MNSPRLRAFSQLKILILLFVGISLTSCAALPFLAPVFVEFARNLLMTTTKNHGGKYAADVNTMLMSFSKPIVATPYPARPQRPQQGGGYPNPNDPYGQGGGGDPYGQGGGGYPNPNDPYGQGGGGDPYGQGGGGDPYGQGGGGYPNPNDPYGQGGGGDPYGQGGGGYPNPNDPYGQGGGGYPNPNDPYGQGGGAPNPNDPYGQGGGGDPYGQGGGGDPYGQGGGGYPNPNDPYGQGGGGYPNPNDPYGQGGGAPNPNDPYGQGGGGDPYGQGGGGYPNPNDPYGQGGGGYPNPNDPYAQGGGAPNPNDPYGAGSNLAPNNSDPPLITESQYGGIDGSVPTGNPYEQAPSAGPTPEIQGGADSEIPLPETLPGGANVSERASHPVVTTQTDSDLGSSNAVSQGQPISIDVALVRQTKTTDGRKKITVIHDGDILKDGGDNPQSGDKFKIVFRTNCDCFVYVASADGSGWAQPLFPLGSAKGIPVKKDQEYVLPGENQSYALDQNKGIESIFFVASPWSRPDIVKSFSTLTAQKKPSNFVALASVEEAPIIPNGFVAMRSAPRARVRDDLGKESFVVPTSYSGAGVGKEVRLTRWFHHE